MSNAAITVGSWVSAWSCTGTVLAVDSATDRVLIRFYGVGAERWYKGSEVWLMCASKGVGVSCA